jgi:hypothetical protein
MRFCRREQTRSEKLEEFQLPDSHPNALANAKWASCINRWLDVKFQFSRAMRAN